MALIKCPECDKEVSDEVRKCIHCGHRLKKVMINKNLLLLILSLIFIVVIYIFVFEVRLNDSEKIALEACRELQSNLVDRKSLELYEVYVNQSDAIWHKNMCKSVVYISYGAKNSYGATIGSEVIITSDDYKLVSYPRGAGDEADNIFIIVEAGIFRFRNTEGNIWEELSGRQINKINRKLQ